MYTTRWCGYCVRAKALLDGLGLEYEEINLDDDPAFRARLLDLTGAWTVPQILIDERPIGGYTELWRLEREGRLETCWPRRAGSSGSTTSRGRRRGSCRSACRSGRTARRRGRRP